jgi:anti-sigma factor RsiW
MNCREAIAVIAEFLEQSLIPETLAEFERHLADCAPCRAYLATYRKTVALTGRAEGLEMPEEMKTRLRSLLLAELRRGGKPA